MAGSKLCALGMTLAALFGCPGCSRGPSIKITGSDTMVNLAQAWQERYQNVEPEISIQVKGGGSGVGIAAMIAGKAQITTSSRPMKPKEIQKAIERTGKRPQEFIVGLDALAIYVHPSNPLESITVPALAEIYGAAGTVESWSDIGVHNPLCSDGEIIRVSRQNSSGTYEYFKEAVLGKNREYKQGATSQSGSSDVVALISSTPCAIGYSGMGYQTDDVKILKVAKGKSQPAIAPTKASASDGSYPISRPLFVYTLGEAEGHVKDLVAWMLSEEGQRVVEESGFVPVPKKNADK